MYTKMLNSDFIGAHLWLQFYPCLTAANLTFPGAVTARVSAIKVEAIKMSLYIPVFSILS